MHAAVLSSLLWLAAAPPSSGSDVAVVEHCVVSLIEEAQVPAKEAGQLVSVSVKEGDAVTKDDLMASLATDDAEMRHKLSQYEYRIAQEQATNDVSVRAAIASQEVAEAEHAVAKEIHKTAPGAVSVSELRRLELTAKRGGLQTLVARMEFKVAGMTAEARELQVAAALEDIEKRKIYAPQDGVVVQVYRHVGEWVQAGSPLLRVVRMDKLRVEGFVYTKVLSPHDIEGKPVTIQVRLGRNLIGTFTSKIGFVSPLVQADGAYRVWAVVENRKDGNHWVLRPGLEATMTIDAKFLESQTAGLR